MNFLVKIVLFLFVTFLSTPTIVGILEEKADMSVFYSFTEEEIHKELNEVKAGPENEFHIAFFPPDKSTHIKSENLLKHDNVFEEIFSPPPEIA